MASDRSMRVGQLIGVSVALALTFSAGMLTGSPRLSVLCLMATLASAGLAWYCSARLTVSRVRGALAVAASPPRAMLAPTQASAAQLEHAPIALFHISHSGAQAAVTPLNANARRLAAPGRAVDPAALFSQLEQLPLDRRQLLSFDSERGTERALATVSSVTLGGAATRLVALMPVESELEAEALNAWRQLVHVLTHEIMNSLTPVASLSRTAADLLDEARAALPPALTQDLATALDAISRRAGSLVDFVGSYRSLSSVPAARPERVRLHALFARVHALVGSDWNERGGHALFQVEPTSLELMADPGQLEQAIINLLKNALEACAHVSAPEVRVSARLARGARLRIEVTDNGPGVADALAAHIFTPFFSTKKQGGGIGLALVRQLIHSNGGTVRYAKSVAAGARFVITF